MPQSVYNISVDGENVFFANNILTHNKYLLCCKADEFSPCFYTDPVSFGNCETYGLISCGVRECGVQ